MRSKSLWFVTSLVPVALAAFAAVPVNLPKALATQQQLVTDQPTNAAAQIDLGNLLLLDGQADAAEAAYRQAIALDPASATAHFNLGLLLQQKGEESAATKEYKEALRLEPRYAWAHYQLGVLREQAGHESAAVRSYAKAFALNPRLNFPDVNPHVLDNKLVTESLLYAYRHELPPLQPGAAYAEPTRIASILIGAPERTANPAEPAAAQADAIAEPSAAVVPEGATEDRTLSPTDLTHLGGAGQATPPTTTSARRPDRQMILQDEGEQPEPEIYEPPPPTLRIPTPSDAGVMPGAPYEPGQPSSGRLEMNLRDYEGGALEAGGAVRR